MAATRCEFDITASRCAECRMLGDCLDEHLPPLHLDAAKDGPLKVIVPWCGFKYSRSRFDRRRMRDIPA